MVYKEHIAKAVEYIEENLKNEIDLYACAKACGYSQYHFLRVFKELTGFTPADYIRKRRISEIAKLICENEEYISEIAFAYGFNSKENFIRAFKAEHNILPKEYKLSRNSLKFYEPLNFDVTPFRIEPKIIFVKSFSLTVYESDENYPPNFWNKYNAKKLSGGRSNDEKGDLSDTQKIYINSGQYAVFQTPQSSHAGFVNNIHRTWDYIYKIWLPNSEYELTGSYEFESYIEQSRAFSEKIFIPIRGK